jgi:hypothetical protein
MRLGAVQGIVLDANGSTVIRNWHTEFGISQATEIDFDLDNASPASGAVRKKCNDVMRAMKRAAEGACGAKMADLEPVFCAPAPGVVQPNPALRAAYDKLEAELGQSLSRKA